jgi:taurine dioxygenase
MFDTAPMAGPFGIEIKDFNAAEANKPSMLALSDAFYQNQFMVIRRQDLTVEQFNAFCVWFGTPEPHLLDHLRLPGFPAVLTLSNMTKNGKQIGVYEGASFWHTDVAYRDPPNSATIAYSVVTPTEPVELQVSNLALAYDALPETMKRKIDGLRVLHHYGNRDDMDENSPHSAERLTEEQRTQIANVYQPLVRAHPITGRKSLYAVAGSSFGIVGMNDDAALRLLDELKEHATQPRFVLNYAYAPGDLAAWDTYATLHKAALTRLSNDPRETRLLWRISVTGHNPECLGAA